MNKNHILLGGKKKPYVQKVDKVASTQNLSCLQWNSNLQNNVVVGIVPTTKGKTTCWTLDTNNNTMNTNNNMMNAIYNNTMNTKHNNNMINIR